MRVVLVLLSATLLLAGCKREAQEAAAQAKGAAAEAQRAASEAAARARSAAADAQRAASDAAATARNAADQATATAHSAADQAKTAADDTLGRARAAASGAGDSARQGVNSAGQQLKELTAGDQLEGVLVSTGDTELTVRPVSGPSQTLHTDARTRWILHGAAAGKAGFGAGAPVRVTYIVHDGKPLATQVEAAGR